MKKHPLSSFSLLLILLWSSCLTPTVVSPLSMDHVPSHPRLLMTPIVLEELKSKIARDTTMQFVHNQIIVESGKLLSKPVLSFQMEGRRALAVAREARRRITFLAYAWRLTNDSRYLTRAEREMLTVSSFKSWNPNHFLDVAEFTTALAFGYDWLYEGLSETTRREIRKSIVKKGLSPSLLPENSKWLNFKNNWNQVCNTAMAIGALAIMEEDPLMAKEIIERSIKSLRPAMEEYGPDGAYPEGYSYWGYGTTFNVLLISVLENAFQTDFGLSENEGFLKTPYYLSHMKGSSGFIFNYSDGSLKSNLNPAMFWFAGKLGDVAILHEELKQLKQGKNLDRERDLTALLIWAAKLDLKECNPPKETVWIGNGKNPIALMRASWTDPNAIFVGFKGGTPSVDHGHMDAGSFVVDALGERWAIDLENQDYHSLEKKGVDLWNKAQNSSRWKVFRNSNLSHNTLSFNDQLQVVEGFAPIEKASKGSSSVTVSSDLSSLYQPYVSNVVREVSIVDKKYVVINDKIKSNDQRVKVGWRMATHATVKILDPRSAELSQNGKRMIMKLIKPENARLITFSPHAKFFLDEPNPEMTQVGFEHWIETGETIHLEVQLMPQEVAGKSIQVKTVGSR